jgi:S-adenosylmethionine:tRNA ribosyltransferase-isomerase
MNQNTSPYQSKISIGEYDYELPDSRIAKYPLERRDNSKLLIYNNGTITEDTFLNLPKHLFANDLLVVNNTRVIHSRLFFQKPTGAVIEIFCLEPYIPSDYLFALQSTQSCSWICFAGNLKKWKEGTLKKEIDTPQGKILLEAIKKEHTINQLIIELRWDKEITFAQILELTGETPIPPYLHRESEEIDKERYQTVYSLREGSVAAPTAGLHFTDEVFERLQQKKIENTGVTLHVGAGTFKPVQTVSVSEHEMHSEFFSVSSASLEMLKNNNEIVSVGTTSLRALESLYWLAIKIKNNPSESNLELGQWDPYSLSSNLKYGDALEILLEYLVKKDLDSFQAKTQIMILPGYKVKSAKALITNFHQPKSTLLLLVSAFVGEDWKKIYKYAMENDFRFLSYGDSSLLYRGLSYT